MYEVGYLHSRGIHPLLFTTNPSRVESLPVYFRTVSVHAVTEATLPGLVRAHLRKVKGTRGFGTAGAEPSP